MAKKSLTWPAMDVRTVVLNESSRLAILRSWALHHQARPIVICCTRDKQTGIPLVVKNGTSVTLPRGQVVSKDASDSERGDGVESGEASGHSLMLGIGDVEKGDSFAPTLLA